VDNATAQHSAPCLAGSCATAIDGHWYALGAERGLLGSVLTPENATPDGVGRYRHYEGGSIYWTPSTNAYEVHGAIRIKWSQLGWERSVLGYPLTDESPTPDGVGRFNHFQGGSIYWTPSTNAHEVHGPIRSRWFQEGSERGALGYPTSDVKTTSGGQRSEFQRGAIEWDRVTGETKVIPS